ncbi:unnamed protein product, partial [Callosobruchus maculatus]
FLVAWSAICLLISCLAFLIGGLYVGELLGLEVREEPTATILAVSAIPGSLKMSSFSSFTSAEGVVGALCILHDSTSFEASNTSTVYASPFTISLSPTILAEIFFAFAALRCFWRILFVWRSFSHRSCTIKTLLFLSFCTFWKISFLK